MDFWGRIGDRGHQTPDFRVVCLLAVPPRRDDRRHPDVAARGYPMPFAMTHFALRVREWGFNIPFVAEYS